MRRESAHFIFFVACFLGLSVFIGLPMNTANAFSDRNFALPDQKILAVAEFGPPPADSSQINQGVQDNADEGDDNPWDEETDETTASVADPLRPFNRAMFEFNDRFYFWILKPVSQGYKAVLPHVVRMGIKNFFSNLKAPIRFTSCALQGKGHAAMAEYSKFVINSTAGVLGFGNPAGKYPRLNPEDEDMGQTLGYYGLGNGIYLVWPFLGPSTLRDTIGMAVDQLYLDPIAYVEPVSARIELKAWDTVNSTSFKLGDYESLKSSAIQPYEAFRNAYIQYRSKRVSH